MKILGFIRCLFAAHEPNRKRIKKLEDGGYIGLCYHCGAKVKQRKRNHWVRDWRRRPALKKAHEPTIAWTSKADPGPVSGAFLPPP